MIYLSIGSNLGDREKNLGRAREKLEPEVQIIAASPVYETAPWGYLEQPAFLNQVLEVKTSLPPHDLLSYLKQIEIQIGRQPNFHYGPRLIDLDILLYNEMAIKENDLEIPHPHITERAFVLVPLADLAPDLVVEGKKAREWVEEIKKENSEFPSKHSH